MLCLKVKRRKKLCSNIAFLSILLCKKLKFAVDNYKIHNINNISHNYDNFKVFNKEGKALIMLGEKKSRKRIALLTMLMMLISIYVPSKFL